MYESLSYGVRIGQWELRYHDFKKIPSLYPPIDEQKLISRYLDKKTNQIDSLVEKIHKKIELLKEQRTSLINHYVTKGLDPNVEMKDSGIEWIGDIPKHWKIVSTKRLFKTYFGGSWGDEPEENQVDNIVKVVRVTEFDMNYLEVRKEIPTLRSLELSKDSPKLLQNGDHILEKSGGGEKTPVGRVVLYHNPNDERVVNSNFTNVCRPNMELVDPYFSIFLLSSLYSGGATVRNIKQTTGIQNLDLDGFMSEKVSIPPLQEQKELSSRIRNSNNSIQNLIQRNLDKINILIEYRQSLISSVVNGKFRVKEDMI
jgi:type I restriction enzyme S subunit